MNMKKFSREFYLTDAVSLARRLLGKILVHETNKGITSGIIVETEAYKGPDDKAAHTYNNKRTARTEIFFREGGFAYVYLVYGMYHCFNVTANFSEKPECVLVRALEPLEGIELMKMRRRTKKLTNLCSGPGKLCDALGITKELYGADLCGNELYILDNDYPDMKIISSPRIGIDYAEEYKDVCWRYCIEGNIFISRTK